MHESKCNKEGLFDLHDLIHEAKVIAGFIPAHIIPTLTFKRLRETHNEAGIETVFEVMIHGKTIGVLKF